VIERTSQYTQQIISETSFSRQFKQTQNKQSVV